VSAQRRDASDFEALLDTAPDAMIVVDAAGEIVLVNAQAERLFGYQRDQLLGRQVELLIPERLRSRHQEHRHAYSAQPTTRPMGAGLILHARHRDGHGFPVEISLGALQSDGLLVSAAIRDISQRIKSEAQARERDARVAAAEAELARHREAQRQAVEINDNIIQRAVLALYAIQDGRNVDAIEAIEATLVQARKIVADLHRARDPKPGDLRRGRSA
jgi:PAS domain S-box-containing protein